ncbi:hypothetical protein RFI_30682, partial [Reticulomyxa filosa]
GHPNTNTNSHSTQRHNNNNSGELSRRGSNSYSRQSSGLNVMIDFLSDVDDHINTFTILKNEDDKKHEQSHATTSKSLPFISTHAPFFFKFAQLQFTKKKGVIFDNQNLLLYCPPEKSYEQMNTLFLDVLSEAKITRANGRVSSWPQCIAQLETGRVSRVIEYKNDKPLKKTGQIHQWKIMTKKFYHNFRIIITAKFK